MAVNTFLPKWKGRPQSKYAGRKLPAHTLRPTPPCPFSLAPLHRQFATAETACLTLLGAVRDGSNQLRTGQRPRATSPLPARAYSVRVGRSLTGVVPGGVSWMTTLLA